jgi:hypothetical protein
MTKNKLFISAVLLTAIIVLIAVNGFNNAQQQQRRIDNLQHDIINLGHTLASRIDNQMYELREQMAELLQRQNSNVIDASYTINGYNGAEKTADISVRFSLKQYNASEPVSVIFSGSGDTLTVPAEYRGGIFTAEAGLELNSGEPYAVSYRMGEEAVSAGKLMEISPMDELYERFRDKSHSITSSGNDVRLYINLGNRHGNDDNLRIVSCHMTVLLGDIVIREEDMMEHIVSGNGYQSINNALIIIENTGPVGDSGPAAGFGGTPPPEHMSGIYMYEVRLIVTDGYGFVYEFEYLY